MFRKVFFASLSLSMITLAIGCNNEDASIETSTDTDTTAKMGTQMAIATISGTVPDTSVSGTARFTENNGKVTLDLQLSVPDKANQVVAVHIHENGSCDSAGKAAGGHWNPTNHQHGKWNENGFHAGDIGNVQLDASGNGNLQLETDLWSIGNNTTNNILNKAIIVHSGADDFTSQPAGNAGSRIGCGLIQKSNM